jgi:hypothetical protein
MGGQGVGGFDSRVDVGPNGRDGHGRKFTGGNGEWLGNTLQDKKVRSGFV